MSYPRHARPDSRSAGSSSGPVQVVLGDGPGRALDERGRDARAGLQILVTALSRQRTYNLGRLARLDATSRALILSLPSRRLLVVGVGDLAQQCRVALAAGEVDGWDLEPVATSRTPLSTIAEETSTATVGALERAGFTSLEELAACPDALLLELRNFGATRLRQLRALVPYQALPALPPASGAASRLNERPGLAGPAVGERSTLRGEDPRGAVLRRCWDAGGGAGVAALITERDDGHVVAGDVGWLIGPGPADDLERDGLGWVRGSVLDVECGAGRLGVWLVGRGHEVRGLDRSPAAVGIARERGLAAARADVFAPFDREGDGPWDSVVMLGGGSRLLGAAPSPADGFRRLGDLAARGGRLILDGADPYATTEPEHLRYLQRAQDHGRPQLVRARWRDGLACSPWHPFLLLGLQEAVQHARDGGWRAVYRTQQGPRWLLVLERADSAIPRP